MNPSCTPTLLWRRRNGFRCMKPISYRSHSVWTLIHGRCWYCIAIGLCKGLWSIFLGTCWTNLSWASSQGTAMWDENPARTQLPPTLYWGCGLIPLSPHKGLAKSEAYAVSHHYHFVKQFIWWWVWWFLFVFSEGHPNNSEPASLAVPVLVAVLKHIVFLMQDIRQWFCETFGPD